MSAVKLARAFYGKRMNEEYEKIIVQILPTLKRIAFRLRTWSFLDEDDLVQEGMNYLWDEYINGRLNGKNTSYLLQGCFFHLRNCCRKTKEKLVINRNSLNEADNGFDSDYSKEPAAITDELSLEALSDSLAQSAQLNETEKRVFVLSLEGYTAREIGKQLGVSHVWVLRIKNRVKEKCRDLF